MMMAPEHHRYTPLAYMNVKAYSAQTKRCLRYVCLCVAVYVTFALFKSVLFPKPDACEVMEQYTPKMSRSELPRIIHQQWRNKDALPHKHQEWQNAVKNTFPQHKYILWTDEEMLDLIKTDYPEFLDVYLGFSHNIMRVDAARTFILHKYGGLYLDMDYEVLENFWDRLPDTTPAVIQSYSHYLESTQNSLMSSPAGHAFWKYTWELMKERSKSGSTNPIYVTGPNLIDQAVLNYQREVEQMVKILPCENWQRVTYGEQKFIHVAWKVIAKTLGIFKDCGDVHNNRCQLGIHHGTTMWF